MPSFKTIASRVLTRAGTLFVAGCIVAVGTLLTAGPAEAQSYRFGDARGRMPHVMGPGADQRANERAMRQAARAQRQQQMQMQRGAQRPEQMQRVPEREMAAPPPPVYRPPDPGDANRGGRPGRLTPEERRALRQQINEAGRDVYRPNGRP